MTRWLGAGAFLCGLIFFPISLQADSEERTPEKPLSVKDWKALWQDLDHADPAKAFQAMQTMLAHPRQAVAFLGEHLRPAAPTRTAQVQERLNNLESPKYSVRQQALKELATLGDLARPALKQAVGNPPSLEVQLLARKVLEVQDEPAFFLPLARGLRGVEILEKIGTPQAREVLARLARGMPDRRLTEEARAALERLNPARAANSATKKPETRKADDEPLPQNAVARLGTARLRHRQVAQVLTYSGDGKILVTHDVDFFSQMESRVRLWDVASGKEIGSFLIDPHSFNFHANSQTETIEFWDLESRQASPAQGFWPTCVPNEKYSACLSPDGRTVAVATTRGDVLLLDRQTGRLRTKFKNKPEGLDKVLFSADGRLLVAQGKVAYMDENVTDPPRLYLWDLERGAELPPLQGPQTYIRNLAISSDGQILATAGGNQDFSGDNLVLWHARTGKILHEIPAALSGYRSSLAFAPDGRTLAVGGAGQTPLFFDVASGKEITPFPGHANEVTELAFTPDGRLLSTDGQAVWLWDLGKQSGQESDRETAERILKTNHHPEIHFDTKKGDLVLRQAETGKELRRFPWSRPVHRKDGQSENTEIPVASLSPDGKMLAAWGFPGTFPPNFDPDFPPNFWGNLFPPRPGFSFPTLCLWEVASGKLRYHKKFPLELPQNFSVAATDSRVLQSYRGFSPFGGFGGMMGQFGRFGMMGQFDSQTIPLGSNPFGLGLKNFNRPFPPINLGMSMGSYGGGGVTMTFDQVSHIAFCPRGRFLALANAGTIYLWNLHHHRIQRQFSMPDLLAETAAFSPDGRRLAARTGAGKVRVWDAVTGKSLAEFGNGDVTCFAFSPDGALLGTGQGNSTILLWKLRKLPVRPSSSRRVSTCPPCVRRNPAWGVRGRQPPGL